MTEPPPLPGADHATPADASVAWAALDALPERIGVIDRRGVLRAVNRAWRQDVPLGPHGPCGHAHEGSNYLQACERASGAQAKASRAIAAGVRRVLAGRSDRYAAEYRRDGTDGERWFEVRITRYAGEGEHCVIAHEDITARRMVEHTLQRQAIQHGLLAGFGQVALENPPLRELMAQANEVVRQGLSADFCRVLEAGPDDQTLVQAAAAGWQPHWLQAVQFDAAAETQDRFVLGARESIVIADFEAERRFTRSPILRQHGVRSAVEVLICGTGGSYGVLGAYAVEPDRFGSDCAHFMQSVAHSLAAAIERRQSEDRLAYLAQFDALTALPNRSLYLDRLGHMLVEAGRTRCPVAVLFIDIDGFKAVNDTLGHDAGDQLLVEVAARLRGAVRSADTLGRFGGDEFAVALPHLQQADDAGLVAQKIVTALAAPYRIGCDEVYVSASIGIAVHPDDGDDPATLLKNADTAMYRAKESGRNTCQFFKPQMHERAMARLRLETQLRGALDRDEFRLHYQPKVDLRSGAISGFEALLRWQPAGGALVSPAEFVPVLEETGLIGAVGEWVIASVCAQIRRWQEDGVQPRPVAINLSARQFRQRQLDAIVAEQLAASGIDPGLLEFELTESMLMTDHDAAAQVLRQLRARGIRTSIDDFGTGYSSLAYLKRFAVDALKIDRTFIRDVTVDPDDATIAVAIINLARSLGLKVIAEGVETQEQLDFLRRHACDEIQGYFFARPLPVEDATRALREHRSLPPPALEAA